MIGNSRKAKIRKMALECRSILRYSPERYEADELAAKKLIDKYEYGLNEEELEYFRTILTFGDIRTAKRFNRIMQDLEDLIAEIESEKPIAQA